MRAVFLVLGVTVACLAMSASSQPRAEAGDNSSAGSIEFRFHRAGEPVFLAISSAYARSNDRICPGGVDGGDLLDRVNVLWPPDADGCDASPATVELFVEAFDRSASNYVFFEVDVLWEGVSLVRDVEVPPDASVYPSPLPGSYPESTVTVRFVHEGRPVNVGLGSPPHRPAADGVACPSAVTTEPVTITSTSTRWPYPPGFSTPYECAKGPPTSLLFRFSTGGSFLTKEVQWAGADVTVDVEVPERNVVSYVGSSTIGVQFLRSGVPVELGVFGVLSLDVDGFACRRSSMSDLPAKPEFMDRFELSWPPPGDTVIHDQCVYGPPAVVTIALATESGVISVDIHWLGDDVIAPVELSGEGPTTTPANLPRAGGHPGDGSGAGWFLVALPFAASAALAWLALRGRSL